MSHFLDQPEIFNAPIRLTVKERGDPQTILKEFFADYSLSELKHNFWEIISACLTSDNPQFDDPESRADLLALYERTETVLEAAFILQLRLGD